MDAYAAAGMVPWLHSGAALLSAVDRCEQPASDQATILQKTASDGLMEC